MTTPTPQPSPESIAETLKSLGIPGSGAAADAWRKELQTNAAIAAHIAQITAAVDAAKKRADQALANFKTSAPTPEEIEYAQRELLAASREDDPRNPDRLQKAEEALGKLLAREQAATDQYQRDSTDNHDQLAADKEAAESELSPEARMKLQQLLSAMATPAPVPSAAPQAAPAASAASTAPSGYTGLPPNGFDTSDSGFDPTSSYGPTDEPVVTHPSADTSPAISAPTLTNVTAAATSTETTPIATSGQPAAGAGQGSAGMGGGFGAPMGGFGGANSGAARRDNEKPGSSTKSLDRDELLNGDDLLNRSVKGRL